jgi:hypothetical protein
MKMENEILRKIKSQIGSYQVNLSQTKNLWLAIEDWAEDRNVIITDLRRSNKSRLETRV